MSSMLELLQQYKSTISAMEWAAFVHDLDKGDQEFLNSPVWHTQNSQEKEKRESEKRERWEKLGCPDAEIDNPGLDLNQIVCTDTDVLFRTDSFGNLSDPFVFHHRGGNNDKPIQLSLAAHIVHPGGCGADGVDSAIDKVDDKKDKRIQKQADRPFKLATPFEKEADVWDNSGLAAVVSIWKDGGRIRECKPYLSSMLGETRIPFNDVTLYDHCFHVASFAKALTAKIILEYHGGDRNADGKYVLPRRCEKIKYMEELPYLDCLKVEFDLAFLFARSHSSGDLRGATNELNSLMTEFRDIFESEFGCGNQVYQDHHRQLFVIPRLRGSLDASWRDELFSAVSEKVDQLLIQHHLEELPFSVSFNRQLQEKDLVENALLKYTQELLDDSVETSDAPHTDQLLRQSPALLQRLMPSGTGRRVCDICGIRFADNRGGDNRDHLCAVCNARRTEGEKIPADGVERTGLERLTGRTENKLVYFSCRIDLSNLRDGSLWKDRLQKASPGRLARSYAVIKKFFSDFLAKKVAMAAPNGYFRILVSCERLDFVVSATCADSLVAELCAAWKEEFGDFAPMLQMKLLLVFFYQKFPFYVVWDAAVRMARFIPFGNWDFVLLDSPSDRFLFDGAGHRRHHILPNAPVRRLSDFDRNYVKIWEFLSSLPKSQISNIEGALVEKIQEWSNRENPASIVSNDKVFARICELFLFAPNAFGGKHLSQGERDSLTASAASGELLDVIDLYIHIENKKA